MAMSAAKIEGEPLGDMNTTPLIDVMLVLLVMFIVTLPIQTHAVKIDLPVPDDSPMTDIKPDKNKIVIMPDNTILWNGAPVDYTQLESNLNATKSIQPEPELQFQPDPYARYVTVDQVIAVIKRSNVGKLGFVGNEQYGRVF